MALAAWAAARAGDYAVLAQRRDADGALVDRALAVVRAFVAERGLILFGGLAIDYALRLRGGAGIYPPGQRPDFDFLSPRSVDDAFDLADRLCRAGFPGVGAVRGIHVQTMRVRTDFVFVADVGYAPPAAFAAIPTFDFEGLRVAHPDFQRMDMHLAFCFPFNGPPREDVAHRWRKDLARLRLLAAAYPVAGAAPRPPGGWPRAACRLPGAPPGEGGPALHGFAAYAALGGAVDALAAALGAPPPAPGAPRLAFALEADAAAAAAGAGGAGWRLEVDCPAGAPEVALASPEPEAVFGGEAFDRFAPFLDVAPETFRGGGAVVHSTRGRLLAAAAVDAGGRRLRVVSPQYLLLWFLFQALRAGEGEAREAFRAFYAATLELLAAAGGLFAGALAGAADAAARAAVLDAFAASPFAPTVATLGRANVDAAYAIRVAGAAARARDTPPAVLGVEAGPGGEGLLRGLPPNYYPGQGRPRPPVFDYGASPLFRRAGEAAP